jgi:hypothetical protein
MRRLEVLRDPEIQRLRLRLMGKLTAGQRVTDKGKRTAREERWQTWERKQSCLWRHM